MVKNLPANTGDPSSIPGLGQSPGEENGNSLQYSCLEIPRTEEPGRLQSMELQRVGYGLRVKKKKYRHEFTTPKNVHLILTKD